MDQYDILKKLSLRKILQKTYHLAVWKECVRKTKEASWGKNSALEQV